MKQTTSIQLLKIIAILEGISYLLFAVTVPLKKIYNYHWPNKIVGMSHGILFIAYIILVFLNTRKEKWSWKTSLYLYVASIIPFGTFVAEKKILK
jgi:integral membrane protein